MKIIVKPNGSVIIKNNDGSEAQGFYRRYKLFKAFINQPEIFETVTNGPLIVGQLYEISVPADGDDFSIVGGDVVNTNSPNGGYFMFRATGATPDIWTNGTELSRYVPPALTVLENDLGGDVVVDFDQANFGNSYLVSSNGLFAVGKTVVKGTSEIIMIEPHSDTDVVKLSRLQPSLFGQVLEIEVYPQ